MEEKQLKTEYPEELAESVYQTGSTKPPKSRRSLILILLGLVIFLGGIATALGMTNIRLFQALEAQKEAMPNAVGFLPGVPEIVASSAQPTGLGFQGETVSAFWHTYHQMPRGIFVQAVDEGSDAARQGVLPGDILIQVNDTPVTALEDLPALLENAEGPVTIVLLRNQEQITLSVQPQE